MKKLFLPLVVSFLMPPLFTKAHEDISAAHKKQHEQRTEKDEKVQQVVASCFGIIQSAIQISQDPHNKQNVGANVGQMIHSIAEVVTQATRQLDITAEEFMEICKRHMLIE